MYRSWGAANWNSVESTNNSVTLTGLAASTSYEAKVFGVCGTTTSDTVSTSFRCSCGTVNVLPYVESFEVAGNDCWTKVGDGVSSGWELITGTTASPAYEGNKYYFSNAVSYGPSPNSYLISPAIHVPANADGIMLTWHSRTSEAGNKYRVMVSTSTNSTDDFGTMLANVTSEGSVWTEHSVSLDNYAGQTIYLAFWHFSSNYGGGVFIDNIQIKEILEPTAQITGPDIIDINTPATFTANLVQGSNINLYYEWRSSRSDAVFITGAIDSVQFHISYPSRGYDTLMLILGNNYGFDTAYHVVYARDLDPYSSFPYSTGFEVGDDDNWQNVGGVNGWYIGTATASMGSRSLYVSNDGGVTNTFTIDPNQNDGESYTYTYRAFNFTQAGDYTLSFDWEGHGGFGIYGVALMTDDLSFFVGDQYPNPNSYTALSDDLKFEWGNNPWAHHDTVFSISQPGVYYIGFCWIVLGDHVLPPSLAIDNFAINQLSCSSVGNLTVDNITTNSLSYSWTPNSGEQAWLVSLNSGDPIMVTDTFYVATGLSVATSYDFSVRALCPTGDTSDAVTITAVTGCTIINSLPFTEDFEQYIYGLEDIPCWTHHGGGDVSIGYSNGSKALIFTPDGEADPFLIVMPEFSMDISGLQFTMRSMPQDNFSGRFQIGYVTDPNDASTFQTTLQLSLDSFINASGAVAFAQHTAYFLNAPTGSYIALRQDPWGSGHAWYVDDIEVDVIDTTSHDQPDTCLAPTNLHTVSVGTTSAVIDWTPGETENQWELDLNGAVSTISSRPYTLTNLTPGTLYSVRVRAICDADSYSDWVGPITFTTENQSGSDTCSVPTNLHVVFVDDTHAAIDWTPGETENQWELDLNGTITTINAHPYTFTDLTGSTQYNVRIRAICGTGNYSEWTETLTFTTTGIQDYSAINFDIYPNPASNNITVSTDENATMTIIDQYGRTCCIQQLVAGHTTIDVSAYASGIYHVRLTTANAVATRKLIIK